MGLINGGVSALAFAATVIRVYYYYATELGFIALEPCNFRFIERLKTMKTLILFYLNLLYTVDGGPLSDVWDWDPRTGTGGME